MQAPAAATMVTHRPLQGPGERSWLQGRPQDFQQVGDGLHHEILAREMLQWTADQDHGVGPSTCFVSFGESW